MDWVIIVKDCLGRRTAAQQREELFLDTYFQRDSCTENSRTPIINTIPLEVMNVIIVGAIIARFQTLGAFRFWVTRWVKEVFLKKNLQVIFFPPSLLGTSAVDFHVSDLQLFFCNSFLFSFSPYFFFYPPDIDGRQTWKRRRQQRSHIRNSYRTWILHRSVSPAGLAGQETRRDS